MNNMVQFEPQLKYVRSMNKIKHVEERVMRHQKHVKFPPKKIPN